MKYDTSFAPAEGKAWVRGAEVSVVPVRNGYSLSRRKRLTDIVLALILLPAIAPVIAMLWVLVRLDGGNGFFGHVRVGMHREPFRCWKLRTMCQDADKKLSVLLASDATAAAEWAQDHKLTNDPRVTPLGSFLRRSSLDELPQIWNVLRGEMSFVGPRPVVPAELPRYGVHRWAYLDGRPGITGLWQISGRNDVSYDERVALDVEYRRSAGFWSDIKLILKTSSAVLKRTGK